MTLTVDPNACWAVLIGTARYDHLPAIPAVASNLTDLERALTAPSAIFRSERCVRLADPEHLRQVGDAVGRAAKEAKDLLLVYYTGHGLLDQRGRLYLALTGSDQGQIWWTAVPFETLRQELLDSPARTRILILDCCFAGRAFEAMTDLSGLVGGATDMRGAYTITSSSGNETSIAPAGQRNTAFTAALLAAAAPGITLDQLYQKIAQDLQRSGHPRPRRHSVDSAGTLRLFGGAAHTDLQARHDSGTYREAHYRSANGFAHVNAKFSCGFSPGLATRNAEADEETRYRRAADLGETGAMVALAMLLAGQGKLAESEVWFRRAADAGSAQAAFELGTMFEDREQLAEAEAWHRRGAELGFPVPMVNLGVLLEQRGESVEAERWWEKAAAHLDPDAIFNLGLLRGKTA